MRSTLAFVAAGALLVACGDRETATREVVREIQKSHIEANVPQADQFKTLLTKDLTTYFKAKLQKPVDVTFEFLRDGPTQSGVAYPKYYLWVTATHKGKEVQAGAVRIAAMEQTQFRVTDFVSHKQITSGEIDISQIFPAALIDKIRERTRR